MNHLNLQLQRQEYLLVSIRFLAILVISSSLARFFIFIKRVKMEFRNGSHDSKDRTVLFEDIAFSPFRNHDPSQSLPTPTSVYRADATGSVRHDVIRMYITLGISFTSVTYGRKALNDQNAICGKHGPGIGKWILQRRSRFPILI